MEKVGLVTLWRANYGSALQCYATKHILQSLGYSCVLVERREKSAPVHFLKRVENRLYRFYLLLTNIHMVHDINAVAGTGKHQANLAMPKALDEFAKQKLCPRYFSSAELKRLGKAKEYTAFLSGSDQVWNGACIDRWMMGFLLFAPWKKRIAFAPSFGSDWIQKYNRRRYKKYISGFRALSARESGAAICIEQLTGRHCELVLDPVLQLSREAWIDILEKEHIPPRGEERYVVACFLDAPS
ncbi:MAG: polysaccharide pyruvyl transferase family protein, partial [Clostridia bacterium]|nr:polysaccharide pyruvyl transferase family protein [Clostridia bacterium]